MTRLRTRSAAIGIAAAAAATLLTGGTAQAAPAQTGRSDVSVQGYIPGKDAVAGQCKGWLNKRSDGYVQAVGQSWNNNECLFVLQRRRVGSGGYGWTAVSHSYWILNSKNSTGYHWNGNDAGSRVCLWNYTTGAEDCGATAW
ncbi:hypothetical protein [Streptomyces sp. WAC 04229]|uniref:hypothetical protein n=1 Tax=Streptomyces sp. WAC 04229 TaxID=2203206 RepID=UPI003D75A385